MEDKKVFYGWLQLDIRPFKHTLMNVIKKWSWMFKEHLLNHVNQRLDTLLIKNIYYYSFKYLLLPYSEPMGIFLI